MRAFFWTTIVAATAAIGLLCPRAADAQFAYRTAPGVTEVSTGTPAYPAGALVPSYPSTAAVMSASPVQPASYGGPGCDGGGCGPMGCDASCGGGCGRSSGCDPVWRASGDYLYLRPRNEGVEFAQSFNANGDEIGPTFVMNPEFSPGFRVGLARAVNGCSEIAIAYTYYRQEDTNGPVGADLLESLTFQPTLVVSGFAAAQEINTFQYADVDFRHNLWSCDCSCLNYFIGMRYAELGQQFNASFTDNTLAVINNSWTNVNFDGVGLRLGMDGERAIAGGFFATAKADVNFVGGEFRADYLQGSSAQLVQIDTSWREARFVSILEAEVAVGWQSPGGRFRASAGYLLTDWCNVVKPSDYINSIQNTSYHGANQMGNTSLIFDGFKASVELAW